MALNTGFFDTLDAFSKALESEDAFVVYFNMAACNVGEALAPKVIDLLTQQYPKIKFFYVDREVSPEIAAQLSVFVVPTVLVFFAGKESFRKSRHFSMKELEMAISRPYQMLFE